jgi:hypothetical protein
VSSVRYELGFYVLEEGIVHGLRRENLKHCMKNYSPTIMHTEWLSDNLPLRGYLTPCRGSGFPLLWPGFEGVKSCRSYGEQSGTGVSFCRVL